MVAEEIINDTLLLDSTESTNTWLRERLLQGEEPALSHGFVVWCREQTAGRGQRGNSWEATPGLNLTMSMLLSPEGVEAAAQFKISEAVALGVAEAIDPILKPFGLEAEVKWPNDIYVGDRKIAGILIENSLSGRMVARSIAGIGLNVNQREFFSDAPNPVSLNQLTGGEYPLHPLLDSIRRNIKELLELPADELHRRYTARLWRREGWHKWDDRINDEVITARILDVALTGHITLEPAGSSPRTYAFKEVQAL